MEELLKRLEEIQSNILKINNFLASEISRRGSQMKSRSKKRKKVSSKTEKSHIPRKKVYGKLKPIVKDIMENEDISRAQAYRKAKKIFLNKKN